MTPIKQSAPAPLSRPGAWHQEVALMHRNRKPTRGDGA
jgi:hypothetical protein